MLIFWCFSTIHFTVAIFCSRHARLLRALTKINQSINQPIKWCNRDITSEVKRVHGWPLHRYNKRAKVYQVHNASAGVRWHTCASIVRQMWSGYFKSFLLSLLEARKAGKQQGQVPLQLWTRRGNAPPNFFFMVYSLQPVQTAVTESVVQITLYWPNFANFWLKVPKQIWGGITPFQRPYSSSSLQKTGRLKLQNRTLKYKRNCRGGHCRTGQSIFSEKGTMPLHRQHQPSSSSFSSRKGANSILGNTAPTTSAPSPQKTYFFPRLISTTATL